MRAPVWARGRGFGGPLCSADRDRSSHALLPWGGTLHGAAPDLAGDVPDAVCRAVRDEDGVRLRVRPDLLQGLEILGDEQQLRDLVAAQHLAGPAGDGALQALDD